MSTGPFNPASVSALVSAVVSAIAAACAFLLGRVPDWDDVRPLAWVAASAALVAGCSFTATLDVPTDVHLWTSRVQVAGMALHVWAWHRYLPGWAGRHLTPAHRRALWALLAVGLAALLPGLVYGPAITPRPLPWLGVTYQDPVVTPAGALVFSVLAAYGAWALWLTLSLGRAGATYRWAHLACTGAILAMAGHDALVVSGLDLPTPYLLDFGFYGPITVLGLLTLGRVGQAATDLRHLSSGLAALVARHAAELERSRAALARAERRAAELAAGAAPEVVDPAPPPAPPPSLAVPVRARILIVDDDDEVRTSFARMLGRTHDVFVSSGVQAGLEALEAARFDLVLCDVMLSGGGAERLWSELPLGPPGRWGGWPS